MIISFIPLYNIGPESSKSQLDLKLLVQLGFHISTELLNCQRAANMSICSSELYVVTFILRFQFFLFYMHLIRNIL